MEKIGFWGVMLCRGKWFGISCLIEKRKRGGRPFFYGRFGKDVCPALGRGKCGRAAFDG